jgi:hypothetical protein
VSCHGKRLAVELILPWARCLARAFDTGMARIGGEMIWSRFIIQL